MEGKKVEYLGNLSRSAFWQGLLKNGLAVFLIMQYMALNYIEAFFDVKFRAAFNDNCFYSAQIGMVFFFAREVLLLLNKSPYKVQIVKREKEEDRGESVESRVSGL